jgi:hypothetical protein
LRRILGQLFVADLGETEQAFDDPKGILDLHALALSYSALFSKLPKEMAAEGKKL